jgi:hypothetical protein
VRAADPSLVLLIGLGTYFRLIEADIEDAWLVIGMNRLRHAYLELAPELEPYFVASHHDDRPGLLQTYAFRSRVGMTHWLSGSPFNVGIIDAVVTGVLAAVVCQAVGAGVVCAASPVSSPPSRPRCCSAAWPTERSAR